ncbi:MAG: hypothetical protein AAGF60_04595 [Pseudomonadota bacterium]
MENADFSALGGDAFFSNYAGRRSTDLHIEVADYQPDSNGQFPAGHNVPGQRISIGPGNSRPTPGSDTIYVSNEVIAQIASRNNNRVSQEDIALVVLVHEIAHDATSPISARAREVVNEVFASSNIAFSDLSRSAQAEIRSHAEHVAIAEALRQFSADNEVLPAYRSFHGTADAYRAQLMETLTKNGIPPQSAQEVVEEIHEGRLDVSFGDSLAILGVDPVTGAVTDYINEQGQHVVVGGRYSEQFLGLYGVEHEDSEGNVQGSVTFGGHLRGLADWLGLDGEFGLQGSFAREDEGTANNEPNPIKPVILDLNGNGIEVLTNEEVSFDWDEDGFRERGAWVGPNDGFLMIDLNSDGDVSGSNQDGIGRIDQAREISFSLWSDEPMTDLQALAVARDSDGNYIFNTNGDDYLDNRDTAWSSLRIWRDLDQDGITDDGELQELSHWGITRINLRYDD